MSAKVERASSALGELPISADHRSSDAVRADTSGKDRLKNWTANRSIKRFQQQRILNTCLRCTIVGARCSGRQSNDSPCTRCATSGAVCDFPQPPISVNDRESARERRQKECEATWAANIGNSLRGAGRGTEDYHSEGTQIPSTLTRNTRQPWATNNAMIQAPLSHHHEAVVLDQKVKPQCFDHDCNGKMFPTFWQLLLHQRQESGGAPIHYCSNCNIRIVGKVPTVCPVCKEGRLILSISKNGYLSSMGTDDIEHFPDARPPHYGQPKFDALRYKGKKEKIREKWRNAQASRQGWKRSKSSSDLKITQEHHKVVPSRIRDLQDIPASAVLRYETSNIRVGFLYSYMYIFLREYRLEEGVLQFQGTKFLPLAEYGLSLLRFISTRRVPLSLRGRNGKESASKSFCLFPHMQKSKSLPRLRWNDVSGKVMFESSSLENRALQSDKYWYDRKFGSHSMSLVYNCMVLPLAVSRTQSSIARQSRKAVGYLLNYLENPMSYLYKMRTYRCAISILRAIKILHPLLQPGKKRITWSCNCGHTSFDDFIELRLGAVSKYEARLRSRYAGHGSRGSLGCCAQALSLFYKGLGTSENVKHSDDHDSERQDASSRQTSRTRDQQPESSQPQARSSLFLLLCLPYMSCGTKLIQPDLRDIESDASFFRLLKTSYTEIKGQLRSRISLKTVTGIRFVQFELRKSEHVNIRKENDLPPEERRAEYLYRPMPAELIPPLGENYTMHLYHHPEHADATAATDLAQIPKKLTDRLCVCPVEGRGVGWGVHFVEGWHYNVVCLLAFALLLLASLVFLICWAVLQHDVQGASGVAAYIVAIATLSVGSVQAAFELELL